MNLLIDNYDSFTYNLYQQLEKLGAKTKVVFNDKINIQEVKRLKPQRIIISPGPKTPNESGICSKVIQEFYQQIPILGVCLGHECIGQVFEAKITHAKKIMHGKTSQIEHNKSGLFQGFKSPFKAARYHSLILNKVPENFALTAWTKEKEIMAIQHLEYPLFGIQFHPESFMTEMGDQIILNFLNATQ